MLLLTGCLWKFSLSLFIVLIAGLFISLRIIGKVTALFGVTRATGVAADCSGGIGFGLIAQGGVAIAMILNMQQVYSGEWVSIVVNIGLVSILINQLISVLFLKKFFAFPRIARGDAA